MAKIPSIALIPSGYKATKIYSQLPTDGSGDLIFNRGTSDDQTRVNSNGLIEDVAVDVPRLDYSDGGCPSLLLEPATTNLITYSEDFTNAAWSKTGIGTGSVPVVTANQGISPKGDLTADRVQFDLGGGTAFGDVSILSDTVTVSSAATTTKSVYIKSNNGSNQNIIIYETTDVNNRLEVLVTTEWQRFELTNAVASTTSGISIGLRNVTTGLTIDDTADILVWGAQLEEQSYATSYVPSLGTSGVRSAETASKTGLSSYINSNEGVLYAEISALAEDSTDRVISLNDGSANNRVILYYNSSNNVTAQVYSISNSLQATISASGVSITDYYKIGVRYDSDSIELYLNGLFISSKTVSTPAINLSDLDFDNGVGGADFYGKTKELKVYKEALSDLELARLTGFTSFAEMRDYLNYTAE